MTFNLKSKLCWKLKNSMQIFTKQFLKENVHREITKHCIDIFHEKRYRYVFGNSGGDMLDF